MLASVIRLQESDGLRTPLPLTSLQKTGYSLQTSLHSPCCTCDTANNTEVDFCDDDIASYV